MLTGTSRVPGPASFTVHVADARRQPVEHRVLRKVRLEIQDQAGVPVPLQRVAMRSAGTLPVAIRASRTCAPRSVRILWRLCVTTSVVCSAL